MLKPKVGHGRPIKIELFETAEVGDLNELRI